MSKRKKRAEAGASSLGSRPAVDDAAASSETNASPPASPPRRNLPFLIVAATLFGAWMIFLLVMAAMS